MTQSENGGEGVRLPPGRITLFAYTVEGNAPLYRTLMRTFAEAKARYLVQLRPEEVLSEVRRLLPRDLIPEDGLERALDQLVSWGNLARRHETGRVATVEDFRRRHFVYQLTAAGEAAELALGKVLEALEASGSLQAVMLSAILRNLGVLSDELPGREPVPARLYEALFNVNEQFRALTENASTFLTRLNEAIDTGEVNAEAFLLYKQAVLEYLDHFLRELAGLAPQITAAILAVEAAGVERLIALAAGEARAPTLAGTHDPAEGLRRQWQGMRSWFLGGGTEVATVELLRAAARSAINRILQVLDRLHEKRFRRVNRTADLLCLARWFEELAAAGDPAGMHRLFAEGFALYGARHFGGLPEDPEAVRPGVSFREAPPALIAPILRKTGRRSALGRAAEVADWSRSKRYLAERHRREREVLLAALGRFAGRGPLALAGLGALGREERKLLLAFLERLLVRPPGPDGKRRARSRDGRLTLELALPRAGERTRIATEDGDLELPAYELSVVDRLAAGP